MYSSSSSTSAMESLPKTHHSYLSFSNNRHSSLSIPFSTLSFRSLPPRPFSSSPLILSSIKASPSPSPSLKDPAFHKPQNGFSHLLQTLNPLFSPLFKPTCIAIAATAFFFTRLQLNPAAAKTAPVPPPAESATAAAEDLSGEEKEKAIEDQLSNNPSDADVLRSLVEVLVRARKIGEAIQVVDRLIELEPEEFELPLLKAHLYAYSGKHELAKSSFEDVLMKDPFRAEAYRGLLVATSELNEPTEGLLKRIGEAVKFCEEQKRESEAREFKLLIAQVKVMEEDYSGALTVYQELVKEEPRDFRPYLCQGVVYTLLRKKDEAEEQFQKYRRLVPENHPYKEYFEDNTKIFSRKLERAGVGAKS